MRVLVDTCIWSYALRRNNQHSDQHAEYINELTELVKESRVEIIGAIRQEVLSGIKDEKQFSTLKAKLSAFSDLQLTEEDYELAAEMFNQLRAKGVQGSNTDFLICAVALNRSLSIYTNDGDFEHFKPYIPIQTHVSRG